MHLNEITKDSRVVYNGKIFDVHSDTAILEDNSEAVREYIIHHGGVCILPLTENDEVIMVRQFRYPFKKAILEIPAGKLNKGEDHFEAGKRELLEETGATAENYQYLGEIYPIPAYTTEIIYVYSASGLSFGSQDPDDDEFLDVIRIPFSQAVEMVMNNEINDSKTQIAVMKEYIRRQKNGA